MEGASISSQTGIKGLLRWGFLLLPYIMVATLWFTDYVAPNYLVYDVKPWRLFAFLETHWTYAYLHVFTFLPVFCLSFDKKVAFYKEWKYLFPAILIMGIFFVVWDSNFGYRGVWGFNYDYLSGGSFLGLPWEEVLFFVTVPYASIFIYACLEAYFPKDALAPYDRGIGWVLIPLFLIIGLWNYQRMYTATTFILTGGYLGYQYLYYGNQFRTRFYRSFLIVLIPFLIVNGVLTGGFTLHPVIVYNPEEFLGIRIITIPIEDAVYGFLHLFGTAYWYHWFKQRKTTVFFQ
jgi:lycopene cyclase domain-containing protein